MRNYQSGVFIFGFVKTFIVTVTIMWVVTMLLLGFGVFKSVKVVRSHGLKGVIEQVWNGTNNVQK